MNPTATPSEPAATLVPLRDGYQVPERFTAQMVRRVHHAPVWCRIDVEMVSGKPNARALAITRNPQDPPLSPADLASLSLTEVLDYAVRDEARRHTPPVKWTRDDDASVGLQSFLGEVTSRLDTDAAGALTAARKARDGRRGRITPGDLEHVRDLYERGGVAAIMAERGCGERQARRLLSRARKEVQ
jgi:hypothetical protein